MAIDHLVIQRVTEALAKFLERELPGLKAAGWWDSLVVAMLTPQQRDMVNRRRVTSLSGLDLAALLRTLDQNWTGMSTKLNWPREVRHFIKETQSLRNRLAHRGSEPADPEDSYRDLDTLQRLMQAIGEGKLAEVIAGAKRQILMASGSVQPPTSTQIPADQGAQGIPRRPQHPPSRSVEPPEERSTSEPDVFLIGCVKTKLAGRHAAKDLFISPLFVGRRRAAEAANVSWFILSAKYGLLSPETVVDSYDVSLNSASIPERRRWSALVIEQFKKTVGSPSGKVIEVHAGASYRNFGLVQGFRALGATVVVPLEHARQGEQLAWYSENRSVTAVSVQPQGRRAETESASRAGYRPTTKSLPEITNSTSLAPFSYRWPDSREEFSSGWEATVRFEGRQYRLRHGVGRRHCFGRERVHSVTWLDGHPMVEGAEAEDFSSTRDLVSVLKKPGGNRDARSDDEIAPAYLAFRVVRHCDAVTGANARRGLAVRIREDDLVSWAHHALLRSRGRGGENPVQPHPGLLVAQVQESRAAEPSKTDLVEALLAFGRKLVSTGTSGFTPDKEADAFVRNDPFAFLVAVICDEQIRFEAAWEAPIRLRERLGHWEIHRIASESAAVRTAFAASPALHRWVTVTADRVVAAAARVIAEYAGDAARIWGDQPTAKQLRERLERFDGVGQKKSAMAVELLNREIHIPLLALDGSDVAVDVHVRRVFLRTGIAEKDDVQHMVATARVLHPERPGELDNPAWEIGRTWCRPTRPDCSACPIGPICPKLIDRAAGVRGA